MNARMKNGVVALILVGIGLALFALLKASLFGWLIFIFFSCCSYILMELTDHNTEKEDYKQKVEKLENDR